MGNKHTAGKLSHKGSELTFQQHETDCPILPVNQIKELQEIRPDAVDLILSETSTESGFRRLETKRVNTFVFIEHIAGQVCALLIGLSGIGVGAYVAVHNQPWAGATIASVSITGLAAVYLTGRIKKSQ